jgi:predicted nucleotidyltransferase
MKNTFYDISGKIDPSFIDALLEIKKVAAGLSIPFFIVGAAARDMILEQYYGIKSTRMTQDIDLGIQIESWDKFESLSGALIATGKFSKGMERQRFLCEGVRIDIVPFGPIADKDYRICWPSEYEPAMSTLGLEEAYDFAITARLSIKPRLDIKISTLAGLAIMKLISWHEKYPERRKDAQDLLFIVKNYEHTQKEDRLYEEELSLLREEAFDTRLACVRLLGQDMAKISLPATLAKIKDILSDGISEKTNYRLITDIVMGIHDDDFDNTLLLLKKLEQGILKKS